MVRVGGQYKTVGDQEHLDIINDYFEGVSMGKIAKKLDRSAATVHAQIHNHHENIAKLGYCQECARARADPTLTFNATAYANTTSVASENVTLSSGSSALIQLHWNTTGFAYGSYEINVSIYTYPVPGETIPANSTYIYAWVVLTIPGSLNGDLFVDLTDLKLLANAYNVQTGVTKPGDAQWNPNADINGDGKIDLSDLTILSQHYNQHYPSAARAESVIRGEKGE